MCADNPKHKKKRARDSEQYEDSEEDESTLRQLSHRNQERRIGSVEQTDLFDASSQASKKPLSQDETAQSAEGITLIVLFTCTD
jgi:hypothetical protein